MASSFIHLCEAVSSGFGVMGIWYLPPKEILLASYSFFELRTQVTVVWVIKNRA
ncbi:hypothetical protein [Helicobacter suis]|nr:hypothetical protein [Helicobacter suis]